MKRKLALLAGTAMFLMAALAGCGGDSTTTTENDAAKVLNVSTTNMFLLQEPTTDWVAWDMLKDGNVEMLTKYNADGGIEPWLAESWSVAEDGITWTFKLREDVCFSNGVAMTATKVVESLERLYTMTDPANGGAGYPQGNFTYSDIYADDEAWTVTIVTDGYVPDLPECLGYPWCCIVDAEASVDADVIKSGVITTGPYTYYDTSDGQYKYLTRNENYWNGTPYFDEVHILYQAESSVMAMSLVDGSIDFGASLTAADVEFLADKDSVIVNEFETPRLQYANFNMAGIFANDTLRQAVLLAVDGESIAQNVTAGTYTYGFSPIPTSLGFDEGLVDPYPYNVDAANQLLDDAGIVDTDGDGIRELDGENIEITFETATARMADVIAQAEAAQMAEIGIKCDVVFVTDAISEMAKRDFDICAYTEVVTSGGDPARFMSHWYSQSSDNYFGYENERYDALYEALLVEFDTDLRYDYIMEMQQILIDDAVMISAGYMNFATGYAADLEGVEFTPSNLYYVNENMRIAE